MDLTREQMLAEMGITPIWRQRISNAIPAVEMTESAPEILAGDAKATAGQEHAVEASAVEVMPSPEAPAQARNQTASALDWDGLASAVAACRACALCESRRQAVLGVGDQRAAWLFIGEGPGAEEDAQGEPFVGQAGKLLDNMLTAIELKRGEEVYIANAVKCRPPNNRTPAPEEMAACRPYLERQIELIRPRLIVLLGRAAAASVLGEDRALGALRGQKHEYKGIPVVVTYHPAYLLRNLPEKAKAWEDLVFARRLMQEIRKGAETPHP